MVISPQEGAGGAEILVVPWSHAMELTNEMEICHKGSVNTTEQGVGLPLVPPALVISTAHLELTFMHHFLDCPG